MLGEGRQLLVNLEAVHTHIFSRLQNLVVVGLVHGIHLTLGLLHLRNNAVIVMHVSDEHEYSNIQIFE